MKHTTFGYMIYNGKAMIVESEAEQVKKMFSYYLSGLSLAEVAKKTGILKPHTSIGRMLRNRRYLGKDFYPPLIDEDTFRQAEDERLKRAMMMGRLKETVNKKETTRKLSFCMPIPKQLYDDPFTQAEYVYDTIVCEVSEDAE